MTQGKIIARLCPVSDRECAEPLWACGMGCVRIWRAVSRILHDEPPMIPAGRHEARNFKPHWN